MVFSNNLLMGAAGQASDYQIDQSIRFNKSASALMSRTFGTPTDRNKFTYAFWMKALSESNGYCLETNISGSGTDFSGMVFNGGSMQFFDYTSGSANIDVRTTFTSADGKFRDYTGWYHAMFVYDSDQGTDSDRLKFFVNGRQFPVSDLVGPGGGSVEWPTSGENSKFNGSGTVHRISSSVNGLVDGYMADIYFIDGQALTPTSFGEFSSTNGEFVPIAYEGSFGNNGFHIDGRDSSDLGDDESGNGNDFSTSNMGTDDQVTDSPTNNQATLNPLFTGVTLSDGCLVATGSDNNYRRAFSTFAIDDGGKHVCEFQKSSGTFGLIGIMQNGNHTNTTGNSNMFGINLGNGEVFKGNPTASVLTTLTAPGNSLMRIEYDSSADTITIFDDGTEIFPASTGVSDTVGLTGHDSLHFGCAPYASGTVITATFSPLSGTPTTGFKELTTTNLSDPTIADPKRYFGTLLYTGNGTTGQTVTGLETTSGTSWTPDWVWIKPRSQPYSHQLFDVVRGAGKNLQANNSNAEGSITAEFIAFADGGFQVDDNGSNNINQSGVTHVAWNWEAGGSGSSNEDGDTTSTVSASTTAGFSIVKWTGTGANTTLGHGLGTTPQMIIVKNLADADSWVVYHEDLGATKGLTLDTTAVATTASTFFNNTAPTSSVFSVGSGGRTNGSSDGMIAYCFANIAGYSKFGGFVGNGSSDGPFVELGFKPAFLLFRCTSASDAWQIYDNKRRTFNGYGESIAPNSSAVEGSFTERADLLSNGFKVRSSNTAINGSGEDYIYMAFAHSPFKTATAFGIEA